MTAGESVTRSGSVVSFSATYLNGRATRALGAGSVGKVHKAVGRYRIESMVFQFPGWLLKRSSRRSLGAHFSVIAEEIVKNFSILARRGKSRSVEDGYQTRRISRAKVLLHRRRWEAFC